MRFLQTTRLTLSSQSYENTSYHKDCYHFVFIIVQFLPAITDNIEVNGVNYDYSSEFV